MATRLTDKQELFALHYAACLNATEAARRAGYAGDDNTLAVTGSENIRKPKIRARIDELLSELTMQPKEILARLTSHARSDMGDFIDPATLSVDWKKAKERGITHLIKKVRVTTITNDDKQTEIFEFELHDPQSALVHLGKAYALFTDKLKVEDWRTQAIADIRAGRLTIEQVIEAFGTRQDAEQAFGDLATQLFAGAGLSVQISESASRE